MSKSTVNASEQKPHTTKLKSTQNPILKAQGLDLSDLDEALGLLASDEQSAASRGKPLSLSLDKVIEDPDQPRKQFDPETLQALANSIIIHGIKSPISVRSADTQGNYRINFGARRRRAAITAGLTEIPAFIDDDHDQYAQVVENIQRDEFKPMEIARFIAKEITNGEKPADIGKRLGQAKQWISKYHSLTELPEYIQTRADEGLITDYNVLYQIGNAAKKEPERVAQFIESIKGQITRSHFQAFMTLGDVSDNVEQDQIEAQARKNEQVNKPKSNHHKAKTQIDETTAEISQPEQKSKAIDSDESEQAIHGYAVHSPLLKIRIKGRAGVLRLDITGKNGFGFVEYEDKSSERISMSDVELVELIDRSEAEEHKKNEPIP